MNAPSKREGGSKPQHDSDFDKLTEKTRLLNAGKDIRNVKESDERRERCVDGTDMNEAGEKKARKQEKGSTPNKMESSAREVMKRTEDSGGAPRARKEGLVGMDRCGGWNMKREGGGEVFRVLLCRGLAVEELDGSNECDTKALIAAAVQYWGKRLYDLQTVGCGWCVDLRFVLKYDNFSKARRYVVIG